MCSEIIKLTVRTRESLDGYSLYVSASAIRSVNEVTSGGKPSGANVIFKDGTGVIVAESVKDVLDLWSRASGQSLVIHKIDKAKNSEQL